MDNDFFFKSKINNFPDVQDRILRSINAFGQYCMRSYNQSISNTDWHLDSKIKRPYFEFIKKPIEEHCILVSEWVGNNSKVTPENIWFQQYLINDYHGTHTHMYNNLNNVMFIELPEKTATQFSMGTKTFQIDVEEGDIITFPGFLPHHSPKNNTNFRKTIISFNSNVEIE